MFLLFSLVYLLHESNNQTKQQFYYIVIIIVLYCCYYYIVIIILYWSSSLYCFNHNFYHFLNIVNIKYPKLLKSNKNMISEQVNQVTI